MRVLIALVLVAAAYFFVSVEVSLYSSYLWFESQGVEHVFLSILGYEARYYALFGLLAAVFVAGNLLVARRHIRIRPLHRDDVLRYPWATVQVLGWLIVPVSLLLGLFFGAGASGQWETISLALNKGGALHVTDPLLGLDTSWYLFTLPLYRFLIAWLTVLLVITALFVMGLYGIALPGFFAVHALENRITFNPPRAVVRHLGILLSAFLVLRAVSNWVLGPANLLLERHRVASGALFTDVHVRYPAYRIVAAVTLAAALVCLVAAFQRRPRRGVALLVVAPAMWVVTSLLALGVVPAIVQSLIVQPTELQRETPYIDHNLVFTRQAFDLDRIKVEERVVDELSATDVASNPDTINNTRVWDVRPLLQSYRQLQGLRPYYAFSDVDVDRYGGTQVMLSDRELDLSKLPPQAQTWVNQHILYTHGFGVVASTVTDSQGQGQPDFLLRDIPPKATLPELEVTRPQIYFGEQSDDWIIVGSNSPQGEFDYPQGDANAYTRYNGRAGVALGSTLRRMLLAWKFGDRNLLLTSYLTRESKIIYDHTIRDVVHNVAPYLQLDGDPYMVVVDGKLSWIWDAYTTSSNFPYATAIGNGTNYMRNSVKVVIDAYDGTATFYRTDSPEHPEPILEAYSRLFPALYQPFSSMPAGVRAHLRYPEDLFQVQASLFALYHITDPQVFYNREDAWNIPIESQAGTASPLAPYYVTLRLPDSSKPEFLLMEPFVPQGKQNMVAWLAARSDPEHYGELLAYKFSKDKLIFGPQQIEARIDQDPTVSSNLTLWNQQGSRVLRGNLLVIPLGNSFLYVEPLFLQAESSKIPELKRIILGTSNKIVIATTLREGLDVLFGPQSAAAATAVAGTATATAAAAAAGPDADLAQDALNHYQRAQEKLKAGDWSGYGTELAAVEADLKKLAAQKATR